MIVASYSRIFLRSGSHFESPPKRDFEFIKWFMRINAFLLRITNGRIGSRLGTQTVLLLETIGRKSGQPRVIPIAYFFHEGKYLIVESNWGKDNHAN